MAVNLFDANYYRKVNADLGGMSDAQAQGHFQQYGLNEGRSFSPFVDLNFYRASNSKDLANFSNQEAYDHLQQYGIAEGRTFCPFVDLNFYKAANGDLAGMNNQQAFEHLQQYGSAEGRTFSQFFNFDYYRRANTDLPSFNNRQLLEHLEQYGLDEGRNFSVSFDANYYRNANSDLAAAGVTTGKQLYNHFRLYGIAETRDSSPIFNVKSYLQDANNSDLRRLNLNSTQAYEHFNVYGYREGRFGCGDYAGNTLSNARAINLSSKNATFEDFVGANDTDDYYRFTLTKPTFSNITLDRLGANVNVELIADANNNGTVDDKEVIKSTNNSPTNKDVVSGSLKSGTYYIHVSASGTANTSYQLKLSTDAVTTENQVPVLDLNGSADGNNFNASFTEDKGAVAIVDSAKLTITDADNTTLKSAKIAISNLFDGGAEELAAKTDDTEIAADYDSDTGVLSLSGDDTLANYEKVLRSLTYNNTSQNPDNADRKIQFTINDGEADSLIATSTVSVTAQNVLPVVAVNNSSNPSFTEDGEPVAVVDSANFSISDLDSSNLTGATVKISNPLDGEAEKLAAVTGDTQITADYDSNTSTLNLSGNDTVANYQQVLASVTYNNSSQNPNTTAREIGFTVNDGEDDSLIATSTLDVIAQNDLPAIDLNGSGDGIDYTTNFNIGRDAVAVVDSAMLSSSDIDNDSLASATVKIVNQINSDDEELKANTDGTSIKASYNAATDTLSLNGTDTAEHYQQVLRSITYNNTSPNPTTTERKIQFTINDGTLDSEIATSTVNVNSPSVLDLNGSGDGIDYTASFTEDGDAVAIVDKANLSVTDANNSKLKSASIKIDNVKADDVLEAVTDGTSITAEYDSDTGVLSLSGEDTLGNYENVLGSVTYNNTSQNPDETARQIKFTINDGITDSDIATSTLSVKAINDTPAIDLNGSTGDGIDYTASFTEDGGAVAIVDSANLSITDDDTQIKSAIVKINNQLDSNDVLAATDTGKITSNYDPVSGTLTLTGDDTLANYEQVLRSVTYNNTSQNPDTTAREITFTINDGKIDSLVATSTVSVTADNDAPVVDLDSSVDGKDYSSAIFSTGRGAMPVVDSANLSISDDDNTQLKSATVKIDNLINGSNEKLEANTTGSGINSTYDPKTGTLTLTGDADVATYKQVLGSVTYNNTSPNPTTTARNIKFTINDGTTNSEIATSNVSINKPPVVDLNGSSVIGKDYNSAIFTEDDGAVAVADSANLKVTDANNTNLKSATVQISNLQNGIDEVLAATKTGNITTSYDDATGILTLEGDDILANYQQVLRSVTYNNTSQNPDATARQIKFTLNDGITDSDVAISTVAVKAVNDTPQVTTNTPLDYYSPDLNLQGNLQATDPDNTPGSLTYTIVSRPSGGFLSKSLQPLLNNSTFTQADIDNDQIQYWGYDMGDDSFTFTVADAAGAKAVDQDGDNTFTFNISSPEP